MELERRTRQLMDLPNELLIKILKSVLSISLEDLNNISLCNKRLLQLTLHHVINDKLYFRLVGYTQKHFAVGLDVILNGKIFNNHDCIMIGDYDLQRCLDSLNEDHLLKNRTCQSTITTMTIKQCLITPRSLWLLLQLFPKMKYLNLIRNVYTSNEDDFRLVCPHKLEIVCLTLSLPILTKHNFFLEWLLKQFKTIEMLRLNAIDGLISKKRHHYSHFRDSIDEWICNTRNLKEILEAEKAKKSFIDCKLVTKRNRDDSDELLFELEQLDVAPVPQFILNPAQIRHRDNVNFFEHNDDEDDVNFFEHNDDEDDNNFPDDIEDFRFDLDQGPFDFDFID